MGEHYSKARKYLGTLENTNPTLLARFPNLATLESVNLIVGFTIITSISWRKRVPKFSNQQVRILRLCLTRFVAY